MLTSMDVTLIQNMIGVSSKDHITSIREQSQVHLDYHKQFAERVHRLEKRLESLENQNVSPGESKRR